MLIIVIFSINVMICYSSSSLSSNVVNITYHPSEWENSWKITAHELVKSNESIHRWTKGCGKVRELFIHRLCRCFYLLIIHIRHHIL